MSQRIRTEEPDAATRVIADRLASLGMLVASVAHEVNNPITFVLGNLSELERLAAAMREAILSYRGELGDADVPPGAEAKIEEAGGLELLDELFADTYEGAIRIRDLVRDLLNLARPGEREASLVNVHEILDSTLRLVNRQIAPVAALELDYAATQWVQVDRAQLGGVFLNLITNAIQACQPPDADQQRISVKTRDTESGVRVEICDTGIGITPEDCEKIFTPFFTTKLPGIGTGLGLYISDRIIHDHGGKLDFRSREGGGTIFSVDLPGRGEA
jgi:signal transduction histidine kinase